MNADHLVNGNSNVNIQIIARTIGINFVLVLIVYAFFSQKKKREKDTEIVATFNIYMPVFTNTNLTYFRLLYS